MGGDITFVPTASGFLYLAVVLDAWSRKIVGWAMANHIRAELVVDGIPAVKAAYPPPAPAGMLLELEPGRGGKYSLVDHGHE